VFPAPFLAGEKNAFFGLVVAGRGDHPAELCAGRAGQTQGQDPARLPREVLPILEARCLRCHDAKNRKGGADLHNVAGMLRGGVSGPSIKPGDPAKSLMVDLMYFNEMPPKKDKNRVTDAELDVIRAWIEAGAKE